MIDRTPMFNLLYIQEKEINMDMRTGEIMTEKEFKEAKNGDKQKLQPLSNIEAEHLEGMPKEERVFEYELANYMAGRRHIKGLLAASLRQAFRAGFAARAKVEE